MIRNFLTLLLIALLTAGCRSGQHEQQATPDNQPAETDGPAVHAGYELYKMYCLACHGGTAGPGERVAPPAFMVQNHYKRVYNREEFIKAVTEWINHPDSAKTLMPGAIRNFNLMPPLNLSLKDRQQIAEYLYEAEFEEPAWAREHMRQERRKRSMRPGKAK